MWFAENLSDGYSVNIAQYIDMSHARGGVDLTLLGDCCKSEAQRLESPFLRLTEVDGVPMQYVDLELDLNAETHDFRAVDDPEHAALAWMNDDYRRPVDLVDDKLVVNAFLRISDERTLWYMRAHHIVLDGYGAQTLVRSIVGSYNARRRGQEWQVKTPASVAELVEYENAYQTSTRRERDRDYWRSRLADFPEPVTLAKHQTAAPLAFDNETAGEVLSPDLQHRLDGLARELNSSVAMILSAAFSAFLSRMADSDDIALSLPVTGRASAAVKNAGGMLSNIVPIRVEGVRDLSIRDLIKVVQLEMLGALRHQRYRSEDIRRDAGLDDNALTFGPSVNMMFFEQPLEIDGADADYRVITVGILDDLLLLLYRSDPHAPIRLELHGSPHLYSADEIAGHHTRLMTFVERFVGDLDRPVAGIDPLLPGEAGALAERELGPAVPHDPAQTDFATAFRRTMSVDDDAVAMVFHGVRWSRKQLADRTLALVAELQAAGVGPGDVVGVELDRGPQQVIAAYAALLAGAVYLPLDPAMPQARRDLIAAIAEPRVRVTGEWLADRGFDTTPTDLAPEWDRLTPVPPDYPAYIVFTSGSTGVPKGVVVQRRALANFLSWNHTAFGLDGADAILYKTPVGFDASLAELLVPPVCGARIVVAERNGHADPTYLLDLARAEQVTVAQFVPTVLDVFLEVAEQRGGNPLPALRLLFSGGERLSVVDSARAQRLFTGARVVNVYGPTETVVDATAAVLNGEVTIGRPVANVRVRVLDRHLRPVPVGVPGEIYVAGPQLAMSYLGRAAATAQRFVAAPGAPGARMYRTGDIARWNDDGAIEYLGRTDFQVKLRGQRVELGEVEAALLEADEVDAAAAVVRTDTGFPSLVAYVRLTGDAGQDESGRIAHDLELWCARRLPTYMVPSTVVVLDEFPATAVGKLDRAALPAPPARTARFVAPQSATELAVTEILRDLLGAEQIGLSDNIFELGADSLTVARLRARLRATSGLDLSLSDVFAGREVSDLVAAVRPMADGEVPALVSGSRPDRIPLSHAQTRLWFINRVDTSSPAYNIPGAVEMPAGTDVDLDALQLAIADLLGRHESLRTRYPVVDGEPVQEILSADWAEQHCKLASIEVREQDLARILAAEASRGFDVVAEPSVRFMHFAVRDDCTGPSRNVLMVVLHHIVADGSSLGTLIEDLLSAYAARAGGRAPQWEPLDVHYADFALWQRRLLGESSDPGSRLRRDLDYWRGQLTGAPDVLALPTDRPRPALVSGSGGYVDLVLDASITAAIRGLAAHSRVTRFTVLHAAFAAVMARLADTDDVVVGTAVSGRNHPATASLIGMFVNTVALRTRPQPDWSTTAYLQHSAAVRAEAMEHASTPFEQVVDEVGATRSLSHSPVFQTAVTLVDDHRAAFAGHGVRLLDTRVPAAKYDLSLTAVEVAGAETDGGHMELELSYSTDLFDRGTVERIGRYLRRMVYGMAAAPDRALGTIDLLGPEEIAASTAAVTGTEPVSLREIVLAADDGGIRMIEGDRQWGSAEVSALSNRLARTLLHRGAGPGTVVAVSMPRSLWSAVSILAVIKSGAAFVSVDPGQPAERRAAMIADSGAVAGVTLAVCAEEAAAAGDLNWLVADGPEVIEDGAPVRVDELPRPVHLDDTAYLIYTSGSTGLPKGTLVSHRGVANLVSAQRSLLGTAPQSRVLHVASTSFDASVFELLMAVGASATLVVADPDAFAGPDLERVIADGGVTHAVMTPSVLATLDPGALPSLQTVMSAGEACPQDLLRRWTAGTGTRFFNLYGPTEATVWATSAGPLAPGDPPSIGHAIPGVGTRLLDRGLRPVPIGVPGELYLTGLQLAGGYLHKPGVTATAFVADPFAAGRRMYRTGDRVVRTADGTLTYLGRSDFQLKIRGIRVEPGELDAVLTAHPAVQNSLSLGVPGPSGDLELVSYVVLDDGAQLGSAELVDYAKTVLPGHLVPRALTVIDEFPTTSVGKIDRRRLPEAHFDADRAPEYEGPRTDREAQVAEVFAQVLGVPQVGVHDSFFELGGNSLGAAKLASALLAVTGRRIPIHTVLEAPTVDAVAAYLETAARDEHSSRLRARPEVENRPLSEVQRSMWLVNRTDPDSPAYNIAVALRLEGELDQPALRAALGDLLQRQSVLRTSYPMVGDDPQQRLHPAEEVLAGLDLTPADVDDVPAAVAAVTGRGFDVTTAPPIRSALLRRRPGDHVLVFVIHHINGDGASTRPLAADLMTAYSARVHGTQPQWTPLRVDYGDFVLWQRERLDAVEPDGRSERARQLAYWERRLSGVPDVIELPTDRPRPVTPSFQGGKVTFEIPAHLVTELRRLAQTHHSTLFTVTHTALTVLLARLSGSGDVVVGSPYAGRPEPALDDLVGMFVNTLPLRTQVDVAEPFDRLLRRVTHDDLTDIEHADVSFDAIVDAAGVSRSTAHNPLYQVMFWFQNFEFPTVELDGLRVSLAPEELDAAQADLRMTLYPTDPTGIGEGTIVDGMRGEMVYARDLYDESTVHTMVERYLRILGEIAGEPGQVVGDVPIGTGTEETADHSDAEPAASLPELIRRAAEQAPEAAAFGTDGAPVSFQALSTMAAAMAAAMPDEDSALVTALMSLAPGLAAGGPDALGELLGEIRDTASTLISREAADR